MPLIGYMVIFNDKIGQYLKLNDELAGIQHASTSISPRLLLIYFGLCFFAVGVTLYRMLCPDEVRHYGSSNAYVGGDGPSIKDFEFEKIEKTLAGSPKAAEAKRIKDRHDTFKIAEIQKQEVNNGLLHLYFRHLNENGAWTRALIWFCYGVGLVCLAIPSAGVFWRVCKILWRVLTEQASLFF